jgi:hypothetical protein
MQFHKQYGAFQLFRIIKPVSRICPVSKRRKQKIKAGKEEILFSSDNN